MHQTSHPDLETLLAYLDMPESVEFKSTVLHLATCRQCRRTLNGLNGIVQTLKVSANFNPSLQDESKTVLQIADYIDGNANEQERNAFKQLLNSNPNILKQALYYATQSAAARRQSKMDVNNDGFNFTGIQIKAKNWISEHMQFRSHWIRISTAGAALALIVILMLPLVFNKEQEKMSIASYQDNPVITFTQVKKLPGIGFFEAAKSSQKPYKGVNVSVDDEGRFHLRWYPVSGAKNYSIRLYLIRENERISVGDAGGTNTNSVISGHKATVGRRYEWELTGETQNDAIFRSVGGFIVMKLKF